MSLFREGEFVGHSGRILPWKIECEALTDEDWEWAAARVSARYTFHEVYGIPRGGVAFARALAAHLSKGGQFKLIADDVLTTGKSMTDARKELGWENDLCLGVALFSRADHSKLPGWMRGILTLEHWAR